MKQLTTVKKFLPGVALSFLVTQSAFAQMLVPMTPGQYMGSRITGVIGDLALSVGVLARENRAIEDELVAARGAYFQAPGGPAREELGRKFEEAMMKRDLHFIVMRIVNSSKSDAPLLAGVFDWAGSNDVDGGISPYSRKSFAEWADFVINAVSLHEPLEKTLQNAMPQFEKYRAERDLVEELFHNPRSLLRAENPKASEYLAAWILGTKYAQTFETANGAAAQIVRTVGPERLADIVAVLRSWSVIDNDIHAPSGWNPARALDSLVAGGVEKPAAFDGSAFRTAFIEYRSDLSHWDPKLVAPFDELEVAWNEGRVSRDVNTLRLAASRRDELVQAIGAARVASGYDFNGDAKLLQSRLDTSFVFIDRAVEGAEQNAMSRGELNSVDRPTQRVAAVVPGSSRGTPESPAAPVPSLGESAAADSSEQPTDSPFDGLLAMIEEFGRFDPLERMATFKNAKQWEYISEQDGEIKVRGFESINSNMKNQLAGARSQADSIAQTLARMPEERRPAVAQNNAREKELREQFIAEMQVAILRIEKVIAALKR
jgi:hypothetical protein